MQTGVLGGHLRVASVGCYDAAGGSSSSGFEMLSLGPLKSDNDTVLIALRRHGDGMAVNASFTYLSASLNQQRCVSKQTGQQACTSTAEAFYTEVLAHAQEWGQLFGGMNQDTSPHDASAHDASASTVKGASQVIPGTPMEIRLPYAERRQVDMAKGVIVSSSTVWIGDEPNYGVYACV
jgi:hypothetical protein